MALSNTFNVSGIYEYFLEIDDNLRANSFEEGVPDVGKKPPKTNYN